MEISDFSIHVFQTHTFECCFSHQCFCLWFHEFSSTHPLSLQKHRFFSKLDSWKWSHRCECTSNIRVSQEGPAKILSKTGTLQYLMHLITFENVQIAVKGVEPRNTGQKKCLFGLDDRWMSCRFFQSRLDMWLACWILMLHFQRFPHIKHGLPTCDVFFFYCLMENAHRVLRSLERRQSLVGNAPHDLCIMLKIEKIKKASDRQTSVMRFLFDDVSPAGDGSRSYIHRWSKCIAAFN